MSRHRKCVRGCTRESLFRASESAGVDECVAYFYLRCISDTGGQNKGGSAECNPAGYFESEPLSCSSARGRITMSRCSRIPSACAMSATLNFAFELFSGRNRKIVPKNLANAGIPLALYVLEVESKRNHLKIAAQKWPSRFMRKRQIAGSLWGNSKVESYLHPRLPAVSSMRLI